MATEITASITSIDPNSLLTEGFELSDQNIIPNQDIVSSFTPTLDKVELWVYNSNQELIGGDEGFTNYKLVQSPSGNGENDSEILELSPVEDLDTLGFDNGKVYTIYNFIRYHLSSSLDTLYYISEISSDRTEIRLKSNTISNPDVATSFTQLQTELNSTDYFDEFYINFGNNELQIGINLFLDASESQFSVLIKLYDALPPQYSVKDELNIITKTAESVGYLVEYPEIIDIPSDIVYLKGPNTNLEIKDFINNSTELKSKDELLNTESSSSRENLSYELTQKGVTITPNYSYNTFNEFINFSSAKKRIENFVEKLSNIQSYEGDIVSLTSITGSTSSSFEVSSSIASAYTNIENIIKNFDGYEYYLYYNSSSFSYPKSGSSFPYTPIDTTDVTASIWLGSDVEESQYYGGILLSASLYDNNNQNWLYYTIPEFIRENADNNQYLEFTNMVGQHFDELWLYTKAVSEKNNTTSDLDSGVPLELADDVITSLGYEGFGNNYNNEDNYIGLTGENNREYVPPTGSELITNYIAVNGGSVINYWNLNYSFLNYVEQLSSPGYPYAIDKVSKEIFKRLYHNMSYLVKKKGTISGLRQLINIWGIPNTILRINEFGGKDKDNVDDYDLWYNRYSYAFHPVSTQNMASASVVFPWMPLERNRIVDSEYIVPDNFQFRFKTTGYPSSQYAGDFFTQSLAVKKSDGDDASTDFDFGIALFYTGSTSGSYSGSHSSEYEDWGIMRFYISGSSTDGGVAVSDDIYLPFFNKGWWSVMLQRDTHVSASDNSNATTYTLYVKNKIYNGWDGNEIGFEGSSSIVSNISTSINDAWNKFGTGSADGIYLGGFVSGSNVGGVTLNDSGKTFSGSLQEFRYYGNPIAETIFNDFVMNPESIEGTNITGSLSSFDIVNFRAPLGNELENIFTSSLSSSYTESLTSFHPAITGAADLLITGSFVNPVGDVTSSLYDIIYYENSTLRTFSKPNTEVYFLDQPTIGLRNRISEKIKVDDTQDYGTTLSTFRSIQQDYQISRSYTEDINNLEVAFSPQDEINDDIIQSFGYGVISDALADPRFISESLDYYPQLKKSANYYFEKYTEGNIYDYLRLIKYFDNSIFKAIKSYVPARTNVSTGIVIKQHLLERNRYPQPRLTEVTKIAVTPSGGFNTPINVENLELTGNIEIGETTGSTGGSVEQFNYSGSPIFGQLPITQSWDNNTPTELGLTTIIEDKEREFYDGEYSGSEKTVTTQSLFSNPFRQTSPNEPTYDVQVTESGFHNYQTTGTGGIPMMISISDAGVIPSNAQLELESTELGNPPTYEGTSSIVHMAPHPSESQLWYITAIVLAENTTWDGGSSDGSWPGLPDDHFNGKNIVYPAWARDGIYYSTSSSLKITPFSRFTLPSPSTGSYNTGSDIYSDGLGWDEIYTMGLGFTKTIVNGAGRIWSRSGSTFPELVEDLSAAKYTTSSFSLNNPDYPQAYMGASQGSGGRFTLSVVSSTSLSTNPLEVIQGGSGFTQDQTITIPSQSLGANTSGGTDLIITLLPKALDPNNGGLTIGPWDYTYFTTNSFSLPGFTNPTPGGAIIYPQPLGGNYYTVPTGSTTQSSDPLNNQFELHTQGERNAAGTTSGWGGVYFIAFDASSPAASLLEFNLENAGEGYADGDIFRFQTASLGGSNTQLPGGVDLYVTTSIDVYTIGMNSSTGSGRPIIGSGNFGFDDKTAYNSEFVYLSPISGSSLTPNTAPTGVMQVTMQATSIWHSESADVGDEWQAYSIVANQTDLNGNYNYPTLRNNPSFSLTLTDVNTTSTSSQNILNKNAYSLENLDYDKDNESFEFLFGFDGDTNIQNSTQTTRVDDDNALVIPFNPYIDPSTINFENSDYYATLNNFNDNRPNTYLMNVEYEEGINIPSNLDLIINNTAERTQTPDSNYTSKKVTKPRYEGVKLQSADYNFYNDGDVSYGKLAVIDKNPIYFAHFKSSKENYELWDTSTFDVDALILITSSFIDFLSVKAVGGKGVTIKRDSRVIKLDGSTTNSSSLSSIFEKDRKVGVSYDSSSFNGVNYDSIPKGVKEIFQGGLEYNLVLGNEISKTEAYLTCSFNTASWSINTGSGASNEVILEKSSSYGDNFFLSIGDGYFKLDGGYYAVSQSYDQGSNFVAVTRGSGLGLIHTLNVAVSMSNPISFPTSSGGNSGSLGIPLPTSNINPNSNSNYWIPTYSGSDMTRYEDFQIPFIIKRGDEIRITWNMNSGSIYTDPIYRTEDFTVLEVTTSGSTTSSAGGDYDVTITSGSTSYNHDVYENSIYNKIKVTPDPSLLSINGDVVNNFTIRRRTETNNRVIVYQSTPSGSQGFETLSGQGYLIPNDLTKEQKDNVQEIINKLKGDGMFT